MTVRRDHHKVECCQHMHTYTYPAGWEELYLYTADLMCLDFCLLKFNHSIRELTEVFTPLNPDIWDLALADHPDRPYASYIINGLQEGFRVGFHRSAPLRSATSNMQSTRLRPSVIDERIADELSKGRMLGPFPLSWRDWLHINRFGLIPKGHDTGKFRLITDLSYPRGRSVNDGIDSDLTSLSLTMWQSWCNNWVEAPCLWGQSPHR